MIINQDILKWCEEYQGPPHHALLCDPPYHLTSITDRFGKTGSKPAKGGVYNRASKGFMNQTWDGGNIAFRSQTWEALGQHLYPGAFGMAFASSRGWHRLAVAIEDAGFIIHPSIFGWVTLSSFPKATRITYRGGGNSPFCECGDSPQQFRGHDFPNNVLDETDTSEDYQVDYLLSDDSDGEQPHPVLSIFQDVEPSLIDAQEHSRSFETSPEIHLDNEPLYNPSQVQCIAHPSKLDSSLPLLIDPALPELQASQDELGYEDDSIVSNDPYSKMEPSQPLETLESGTLESHKYDNDNLAYNSLLGSFNMPFPEIHTDDTTNNGFCQNCGKIKKEVWNGHRYGLQSLKNALEPIILFQKPYEDRPVDSITETGAGALNIDGGRISSDDGYEKQWDSEITTNISARSQNYGQGAGYNHTVDLSSYKPEEGRWPANLILDEEGARRLDLQSGILTSGGPAKSRDNIDDFWTGKKGIADNPESYNGGDSGGASRMFFQSHWSYEVLEQLEAADSLHYEPKVSTAEREAGLNDFEYKTRNRVNSGGYENDPKFAPTKMKNHHPTLKPISLTKYLATLLLPPEAYAPRRILVPFAGTGSEMIGATLAGWVFTLTPVYQPVL